MLKTFASGRGPRCGSRNNFCSKWTTCIGATWGLCCTRTNMEYSSDSLAMFAAIRRASSLVSSLAATRFATSPAVAYDFWQMAVDYQESAAKLSGGKLPIVVVKNAPDNSGTPAK